MFLFPEQPGGDGSISEGVRDDRLRFICDVQGPYCIARAGEQIEQHFDRRTVLVQVKSHPAVIKPERTHSLEGDIAIGTCSPLQAEHAVRRLGQKLLKPAVGAHQGKEFFISRICWNVSCVIRPGRGRFAPEGAVFFIGRIFCRCF